VAPPFAAHDWRSSNGPVAKFKKSRHVPSTRTSREIGIAKSPGTLAQMPESLLLRRDKSIAVRIPYVPDTFSRFLRQAYLVAAYTLGLIGSLWLAYLLRFDFDVPADYFANGVWIFSLVVGTKLLLLLALGQFGSLLSYFGFHDLGKLLLVSMIAALLAVAVWRIGGVAYAPPRAVIVTDLLISFLFLCGFRLSLRLVREGYFNQGNESGHKLIAVIGAGDVGASLAKDFQARRGLGMTPKAFFDDDRTKWGTSIHGVLVQGAPEMLPDYLRRQTIDEVVIAMPSAAGRRIREIVTLLNQLHIRFEIVPSYEQLLTGKVRVSQIRPVEIQDLLGRKPIDLQNDRIRDLLANKVVLVTGAGGSIGAELCRQIAAYAPRELVLVERSEFLLFQIEQELKQLGYGSEIVPLVADLMDSVRMEGIFQKFRPCLVFHAAAHKHVPMMEYQPGEAFRNNCIGTRQLAELSLAYQTERFVLISSDKAVNPTNVMGATKRVAEQYIQALQRHGGGATRFMAVRFGNVLGSSGSVIPTLKRQIAAGGPVTVTHPEITRYFMTVNEAVGLVLQSATLGEGGEIFVLDMGQPMKIVDLARQLIELSGLQPDTDIEIKFTGLRPGEKLYEELTLQSENLTPTEHSRIMRFACDPQSLDQLRTALTTLYQQSAAMEPAAIKQSLKNLVPEYQPYLGLG
jgi:FlaA1/EpsC-like NDP-sugar epimerase